MTTAASQVTGDLPRHVAIIMDGNNRWAKAQQLKPQDGHSRGAEVARKIVAACVDRNIPYLTLFAFSSENWLRPQTEVRAMMALFLKVLCIHLMRDMCRLMTVCLRVGGSIKARDIGSTLQKVPF